jgi:hypothetical protein
VGSLRASIDRHPPKSFPGRGLHLLSRNPCLFGRLLQKDSIKKPTSRRGVRERVRHRSAGLGLGLGLGLGGRWLREMGGVADGWDGSWMACFVCFPSNAFLPFLRSGKMGRLSHRTQTLAPADQGSSTGLEVRQHRSREIRYEPGSLDPPSTQLLRTGAAERLLALHCISAPF